MITTASCRIESAHALSQPRTNDALLTLTLCILTRTDCDEWNNRVEVFDHFGTKLDKRTIVHVWKDKSDLNAVVAAGYNALINNSPGSDSWCVDLTASLLRHSSIVTLYRCPHPMSVRVMSLRYHFHIRSGTMHLDHLCICFLTIRLTLIGVY